MKSGLFLDFHYKTDINLAFQRIIDINRIVNFGRIIRFSHTYGALVIFITIYIHIRRGVYINSFDFKIIWTIAISLLFY